MLQEKLFIPLNEDLLFKETMCHSDNRQQLIQFLVLTTHFSKKIVTNNLRVKYESVLTKTRHRDKAMRTDVIIEFDKYQVNLESYSCFDTHSLEKSVSYIMRIFSTQLDRGANYNNLESVIQINLIDELQMAFNPMAISDYYITNAKNLEDKLLADKFLMKCYRLDKIRQIPYNELDEETRWIRFIGAQSSEERKEIAKGDELLMELDEWVEEFINDEKTKKIFGEWGEKIAHDKGVRKGVQQGIKSGKTEIAKNMLQENMPVEMVQKYTKISIETIEKLKKEVEDKN